MARRRNVRILVVEDNPADIALLREALKDSALDPELHVSWDGQDALEFLYRSDSPKPDLILLNLNLPRKSGHEVLEQVKADARLRHIPVIVLSSSGSASDVGRAYDLQANCFIQKPTDLDAFLEMMRVVEDFWLRLARLPSAGGVGEE